MSQSAAKHRIGERSTTKNNYGTLTFATLSKCVNIIIRPDKYRGNRGH